MDTSKIIIGTVGGGRYTVTAPIVKEDYGLYLKIESLELPATYEVDFSNDEHNGTSVTMIGNADGVLIPRQFISSGKDVFAFLYHVGADFGRTVYKFRIPNKLRPDRTNEQPTPEEQSTIDQAISALNTAVEQTAQDVIDADASAQSASQSAENAHDSAVDAQNYAESAQTYANNASASASQASASATASAQSASDAETARQATTSLVAEAQGYANASAQSAQASAQSASQAHQFAQTASLEAESAQDYATQADISANTASNKAQEASTSAQTASTKATESANSASQASGYKDTAEQAKNDAQTAQTEAEDARDDAQTAQELAENAESNAESTVHGVLDSLDLVETSGSIVETHDAFPVSPEKMVVDINPVQDLSHGDPSPENICPISGWTQVDVEQSGKNLAGFWRGAYVDSSGNIASASSNAMINPVPVSAGDKISITRGSLQNAGIAVYSDAELTTMTYRNGSITTATYTYNFTSDSYVVVWFNAGSGVSATQETLDTAKAQVEIGNPTAYEPYNGASLTISLGQTVYGGKLDVLSGELVIDRAMVDLGSLNWSTYSLASNCFKALLSDGKVTRTNYSADGICSSYAKADYITTLRDTDSTFGVGYSHLSSAACYVAVHDSRFTDATAFKTAMSGVQLVYELAEPIEIQLTPQQITLFKDYNVLWADTGDISEFAYRTGEFATKADIPNVPVENVQVNGTSVVENKVANIDLSGIEQNAEDIASLEEDIFKPYAVDSASGSIASFADGADDIPLKSLVVDINPVQDLHGYDSPWPAGGGKNKIEIPTFNNGYCTWSTAPKNKTDLLSEINKLPVGDYVISGEFELTERNDTSDTSSFGIALFYGEGLSRFIGNTSIRWGNVGVGGVKTFEITVSITSEIAGAFTDVRAYGCGISGVGTTGKAKINKLQIEEGSTATAYAPYENICPISGWTEVDVEQSGKNLLTYTPNKIVSPLDVTLDKSRATLVKKGVTYTMSFDMQNATTWRICAVAFDLEGNRYFVNEEYSLGTGIPSLGPNVSGQYYVWGANYTYKSFMITPIDDFYVMLFFLLGDTSASTVMVNPMLEIGSTPTPYEPYTGRSITISLGQTVYGGKLDVLSGVLRVEMAMATFDGSSDENWSYYSVATGNLFRIALNDRKQGEINASNPDIESYKCDAYKVATNHLSRITGTFSGSIKNVDFVNNEYSTLVEWRQYLSENNVQFVYPLAEPIEIQLTPHEVNSLLGANNIWADTGDVSCEYRADAKLYISRLTEPDADMVADANITSGKYFMVGNNLYLATANIASGASVIVGTNAIRKSLSEALNEINS